MAEFIENFSTDPMLTSNLFNELRMSREQIHKHLQQYLLSRRYLLLNRFPVFEVTTITIISGDGRVSRKCSRCNHFFEVTLEGKYLTNEKCTHHPLPLVSLAHLERFHPCCNGPFRSTGCTTYPLHVCKDQIPVNGVNTYINDKRHVQGGQLCKVYALDCQMVYTGVGQQVAKIGLVDIEGMTMLDTYIQPDNEVVDYCTTLTGITPEDLEGVPTTLRHIQAYLDKLLSPDCILIGNGLDTILSALRHPHMKVVDTAIVFERPDGYRINLYNLTLEHFYMNLQNYPNSHDCIENARASMALMLNKIKIDNTVINNSRTASISSDNKASCSGVLGQIG